MTMRLDPRAEADFAAAMSVEMGAPAAKPAQAAQRPHCLQMPHLRAGGVSIEHIVFEEARENG
ncbi:MAG TPA: hypothetical protein VIF40_17835 [Methylosinus sp.]|jgi:hypothetical protein|uniref:hypothetical protein n=1 Tax=Methylosinus sp. TaxID=427 RepID=UPI002F92301C